MKKIECILRPNKLKDVKDALDNIGVTGMTVTEAIGFGKQKGHTDKEEWNAEFNITLLPKTKIEMVVTDELVDEVINIIIKAAKTGEIGDGKIFTYPISNAIRIRTGEDGDKAL